MRSRILSRPLIHLSRWMNGKHYQQGRESSCMKLEHERTHNNRSNVTIHLKTPRTRTYATTRVTSTPMRRNRVRHSGVDRCSFCGTRTADCDHSILTSRYDWMTILRGFQRTSIWAPRDARITRESVLD